LSGIATVPIRADAPLSAAPALTVGPFSRSTIVRTLLGAVLVGIVAAIPLPWMLAVFGGVGLLIAMLIAPIVGLYAVLVAVGFSPTFGLEDAAFSISAFEPLISLVFLFWLLQGITRHQIRLPREGLFGALILLLTLLFLAGSGATSFPLAFKETLKWILLILAYIYTRSTVRDDRAARGVLIALFLTGAAEALLGAVQFFGTIGPGAFGVGNFIRAYGMFGQPNPYAGYLGTILPIAIAMTLIPQPGRFRVIAAVCSGLIAMGIILSLSRGAWVGVAISLGVMAMAWSPRARKLVIPMAGLSTLLVALAVFGLLPTSLATRITSVTDNFGVFDVRSVPLTSENFAVVERMAHWQAGWYMFEDYPFLGVGPGNYPAVYEEYYIPPWREPLGHAHNYYLNMAAEVGVPGLLALLLVLGLAFRALVRRIRAADQILNDVSPAGTASMNRASVNRASPAPTVGGLARPDRPPSPLQGSGDGGESLKAGSGPIALDPPFSPLFARALALGLLGSLAMFSIHNLFDNLLVHGVGIQVGVLLGLIGGVSDR
jgi:putative inorganic carbon (HCO3(-)) transporter